MTLSTRLNHLPPLTPLTSADTMRSVQIEASTHHHVRGCRRGVCPLLSLSGTAETVPCSIPVLARPASCLPSLGAVLLPALSTATGGIGIMKALTPAALTLIDRSLRLLRLAVPTFHPQPRGLSVGRFVSRLSAERLLPGFATNEQARHSVPPKQVRHPTDCRFTSGCSPPRLAATQLPSITELRPTPARTSTVQTKRPHGRTRSSLGLVTNETGDCAPADLDASGLHEATPGRAVRRPNWEICATCSHARPV